MKTKNTVWKHTVEAISVLSQKILRLGGGGGGGGGSQKPELRQYEFPEGQGKGGSNQKA